MMLMAKTVSLKKRTMRFFFLATFLSSFLVGIICYIIAVNLIKKRMISSYDNRLLYIGSNIESALDNITAVSDYLYMDNDILNIVNQYPRRSYDTVKATERVTNTLTQGFLSNTVENLNAVQIVSGKDFIYSYNRGINPGRFYIDRLMTAKPVPGSGQPVLLDESVCTSFSQYPVRSIGLLRALPVLRSEPAYLYLSFRPDILTQFLDSDIQIASETLSILTIDGNSLISEPSDYDLASLHQKALPLLRQSSVPQHFYSSSNRLVFLYPLVQYGCYVMDVLPSISSFENASLVLFAALFAIAFAAVISLGIWHLLFRDVIMPINALSAALMDVEKDIYQPLAIPKTNIQEINGLIKSYDYMLSHIRQLIAELTEKELAYKILEYKALQSQIDSHFVHNTLNSIRWMAIIQKADNIKQMIDSLSRLLKSCWHNMDSPTTFQHELEHLRDYLFLQNVSGAYRCQIEYELDEDLLLCECIKFMLQPVVENALFHGLSQKRDGGRILIRIALANQEGRDIRVTICDNGTGMEESQIQQLLGDTGQKGHVNGIGIANIHERIKLKYGESYGIQIESRPGQYTKVSITIPRR